MIPRFFVPWILVVCAGFMSMMVFSFREHKMLPEYKLVWADEFNINGAPDTASWSYERGFVRNLEDQWYQPENARCENGFLVIEARKESRPNPNYEEESKDWKKSRREIVYTSSSINTRGKKSWLYGRFEMRGRIDTSTGLWPAWWTLGVKGRWPQNGEIDIMEFYRGKILANIAMGEKEAYKAKWFSNTRAITSFKDPKWQDKFHVWRMDWEPEKIALYVDDELLNEVHMNDLTNRDGTGINPFRQEHYMLLNFAIGGQNGGDPSKTTFPRKFEVDYVRVYQKE
ncbi:MAG: glycoside hydrolase family 16 protein [Chitinophagaceae bacterium]